MKKELIVLLIGILLLYVWSISPTLFEVGITNLVCGCILGWWSVPCHFQVTVTLTLTSFRSPILLEVGIPKLKCGCDFEWQSVVNILGHFYHDLDLPLFLVQLCP